LFIKISSRFNCKLEKFNGKPLKRFSLKNKKEQLNKNKNEAFIKNLYLIKGDGPHIHLTEFCEKRKNFGLANF